MDGNRVLLKRPAPEEALVRGLWQLLPDRTRVDLWPGSFAFSDELNCTSRYSRLCRLKPVRHCRSWRRRCAITRRVDTS